MRSLLQMFQFATFTLTEYARSGRILIEVIACGVCALVFFRPEAIPPTPEYFFSITGTFALGICLYTASAIFALGDRSQSYIVLVHGLGRAGYLFGLYISI